MATRQPAAPVALREPPAVPVQPVASPPLPAAARVGARSVRSFGWRGYDTLGASHLCHVAIGGLQLIRLILPLALCDARNACRSKQSRLGLVFPSPRRCVVGGGGTLRWHASRPAPRPLTAPKGSFLRAPKSRGVRLVRARPCERGFYSTVMLRLKACSSRKLSSCKRGTPLAASSGVPGLLQSNTVLDT